MGVLHVVNTMTNWGNGGIGVDTISLGTFNNFRGLMGKVLPIQRFTRFISFMVTIGTRPRGGTIYHRGFYPFIHCRYTIYLGARGGKTILYIGLLGHTRGMFRGVGPYRNKLTTLGNGYHLVSIYGVGHFSCGHFHHFSFRGTRARVLPIFKGVPMGTMFAKGVTRQ